MYTLNSVISVITLKVFLHVLWKFGCKINDKICGLQFKTKHLLYEKKKKTISKFKHSIAKAVKIKNKTIMFFVVNCYRVNSGHTIY